MVESRTALSFTLLREKSLEDSLCANRKWEGNGNRERHHTAAAAHFVKVIRNGGGGGYTRTRITCGIERSEGGVDEEES